MRIEIGAAEDELRKLRDRLAEIEIENESYKVLVDAEKQLSGARGEAELTAVRSVNADLKDHIKRLKRDVEQGEKNRQGAWELIEDLKQKYQDVAGNFE